MVKMWRPKNYREALFPIQLISWFFCLGIIQYPLNHPKIGLTIFYTVTTTSAYYISLGYMLTFALNENWFKHSEAILFSIIHVNIFIYMINLILIWIWRKRMNNIMERATEVDEILEQLEIPLDYRYIYVLTLKTIFIWSFLFLTTIIIDMMWLNDRVDLFTNFIVVSVLLYSIYANTIVTFSIGLSIQTMGCRFQKVNELLANIANENKEGLRNEVDRRWPPILLTGASNFRCGAPSTQNTSNDIIRMAKYLHLELSLLCNECSQVCGIQLAMELASSFVVVTGVTFVLYIVMTSTILDDSSKQLRIIVLIYWLIACYIRIISVNIVCANTVTEWKKTGKIIHELAIVNDENKHRDGIREFSLQIMQNPVSFTACGLITLGYSFIRGFIGTVTTYVVILVQMYDTTPK